MAIGLIVAGAAAFAGGLLGAFGKKKAGDAAKEAAFLNAKLIEKRGETQATFSKRGAIKGIGATLADIGAAGLTTGGSAAELLREGERDAAFELESIREQTKLEAKITRKGGKAAQTAGNIGAVGSIIGGIGGAASAGVFG
jgi:hypothetical protein